LIQRSISRRDVVERDPHAQVMGDLERCAQRLEGLDLFDLD
jgi:hypothetical protein